MIFPEPVIAQAEADEGSFKVLMSALLVIMPNNPVCLIAGVVRVPIARFIALNVIGTVGRVLLMRWIGYLFEDQIQDLLEVVVQYQKWFLLASIAGVIIYVGIQATRRQGLIGAVEELEDELGD
jgi:membrane protein DedA with SNARE-associated domain